MSKVSKTKLYDSIGGKLGKENADDLITYFEDKIDENLESKLSIFATKEDLARGLANLESKISESRSEAKDMFAKLESKMSEWRIETKDGYAKLDAKIDESEKKILEKIHQSELNTLKEIHESEKKTVKEIHQSEKETLAKVGQYKVDTLKWMVGLILTIASLLYTILK